MDKRGIVWAGLMALLVALVACGGKSGAALSCGTDEEVAAATTFLLSDQSAFRFDEAWQITHVIEQGGAAKVYDGDGTSVTIISPAQVVELIETVEERDLEKLALEVVGSEWEWERVGRERYGFDCGKIVQADYEEAGGGGDQFSIFILDLGNSQRAIATALFQRGDREERLAAVREVVGSFKRNEGALSAARLSSSMFLGTIERFAYRVGDLTFASPNPVTFEQRDDGVLLLAENPALFGKVNGDSKAIRPLPGGVIAYLWTLSAEETRNVVADLSPAKVEEVMRSNCVLSCRYFVELAEQFAESPAPLHPAIVALGVAKELGFGYQDKELEWSTNCMSCEGIKLNVEQEGAIWAEPLLDGAYVIMVHYGQFEYRSAFRESLTWVLDSASTSGIPDFRRRELSALGLPIPLPEGTVRVKSVRLDQSYEVVDPADPGPAWSFRYPQGRQWQVQDEPMVDIIPGLPSFGGALPVILKNSRNDAALGIYGPQDALMGSIGVTMMAGMSASGLVEEVQYYEYENQLVAVYQMTHPTEGRTGAIAMTDTGAMVMVSEKDEKKIGIETVAAVAATVQRR